MGRKPSTFGWVGFLKDMMIELNINFTADKAGWELNQKFDLKKQYLFHLRQDLILKIPYFTPNKYESKQIEVKRITIG